MPIENMKIVSICGDEIIFYPSESPVKLKDNNNLTFVKNKGVKYATKY